MSTAVTVLSGRYNVFPSDKFFFCVGGRGFPPPHLFVSVIIHRFVQQLPTPSRFTILTLNSSMILRMPLPRAPMMRAWTLLSRVMSSEIISSSSSTMAWMASRAAMALCSYPVIVIWSYGDTAELIKKQKHPYTKHLARYRAPLSGSPFRFNTISHRHTWFSSFFSGNWMLTSCSVRMFVIMAPLRPIILGWYLGSTVMVSLKLLSACRGFEKRWQNVGLEFHKVWQLAISHYYSTWCLPKIRLIIKPFVHLRIMIRVPFELIWKD